MEYTKDMILNVCYDEVQYCKEPRKRTSRFWRAIKKHKIMSITVFSAFVFIGIDMVLLANFFTILANY